MNSAELKAVKEYMRVDGKADDMIIAALYSAAELYLRNAGIVRPENDEALYMLALWGLTLHYYDHRGDVGNEASIPNGLRPVITQLKAAAYNSA